MQKTFVLRDPIACKQLHAFLKSNWLAMAQAGKPLAVSVSEHKSKRSLEQNAKYWAILADIANNAWIGGRQYSKEQWHMYFAGELIGWDELPNGKKSPVSTSTLSIAEFSDYIERVMQFSAEDLGVVL